MIFIDNNIIYNKKEGKSKKNLTKKGWKNKQIEFFSFNQSNYKKKFIFSFFLIFIKIKQKKRF